MSFKWRYETADGQPVEREDLPRQGGFPTQSDAESWIGEVWPDLLDAGVDQVSLLEDNALVYGPMSLHSAD
jgi:hypothetical protein